MAAKLMRAVWYSGYGGGAAGLEHVEVPVPAPAKDEVLLKLEAASLNPINWKMQKGMLRPLFLANSLTYQLLKTAIVHKEPLDQITDVAGEVVEVGSGVKDFKLVTKLFPYLANFGGGLAEFAVAKENLTVSRPAEVSAAEGAGLPIAGLTAHQALTRWHSWSTFEPNLSTNGKVIDITPTASTMLTFALKKLTFSKKQLVPLVVSPKKENLECLVGLVKEGKLKTVIDSKHPLSKAEDAWAKSIDGHATGKIIVEP
ncbi:Quinone-oxidoreductase-like, chloroplastic [Vitis vinifera]|uniref:Quinone-oxidoreductase-like, chloroplastic n=1 Tax=Vitis vinifera TaxID=29760 RepID=A0A438I7N2_VITVI|nr:Quinone-oxidoreductase-like, chloroplastic [Vitis vinifera]